VSSVSWDPSLETGDELVDHHHKTIHQLLADLESHDDNAAEIMHALEFLTEYVLMHFAAEEALMRTSGFPEDLTAAHMAEHRRLTEATRQRVFEFRDGRLSHTSQLTAFVRAWLASHLHECDRILLNHVQELGGAAQLPLGWAIEHPRVAASQVRASAN
jgi:hemerythrin